MRRIRINSKNLTMPSVIGSLAALLLLLTLVGCFQSDHPLLNIFNSVTPVAEGRYNYEELSDKSKKSLTITHDGTVTKMISTKADGSVQISKLYMHELGDNFYIVMDPSNDYSLIHVNSKAVLEFDETYCDDLLDLARSTGKSISEYGVAKVVGEKSHSCQFTDLDDLKTAMVALINNDKIVVARIYKPQ